MSSSAKSSHHLRPTKPKFSISSGQVSCIDSIDRTFDEFAFHLHTNTIGPILVAQKLLKTNIPIGTIVFMSSDSGSAQAFREMEDGFAAYAASKAALNQMMRVSCKYSSLHDSQCL